ncbi:hypothetical protein [Citricoccus sp. K5]|uniref:hypothetical protein n=1 Tax=Citricoccus sp. K5 TaxID=2653135 RepID=UPI0012F274F5|nr:hypothetical protein [Citricoccus sp. K5]VXB24585.1 hypothetical protein CITRIK5_30036 [Citricoccus sp. K5]
MSSTPEFRENMNPIYPGHAPANKKRRLVLPAALAVGGLVVGIGTGGGLATALQPEPETVMVDRPVEVEKVVTETVTEEVEVPVTPDACITALDHADGLLDASLTVIDVAAGAFGLIPRAAEAGMDYDVAVLACRGAGA